MKIAIFRRRKNPLSLEIYTQNVTRELKSQGVKFLSFSAEDVPPKCDLVWDPSLAGNCSPHPLFKKINPKIVATVHGAAPFTLKLNEHYENHFISLYQYIQNKRAINEWRWFKTKISAIITPSKFGMEEVSSTFKINPKKIFPIYHGIDHQIFHPSSNSSPKRNFYLHISQYRPKKNINRILQAYRQLNISPKPPLILIIPGFQKKIVLPGGKIITKKKSPQEIADYYRRAKIFIFPSLHESFGMPILEAMACGCPVITSNNTSCREIAGKAAILVDPRSVEAITRAMQKITTRSGLQKSLQRSGTARSHEYTWKKAAEDHLKVFRSVIR